MCISLNKFIILCSRWIPRPIQLFLTKKMESRDFGKVVFHQRKRLSRLPAELFWTSLLAFVIQVLRYVTKLNVSYTKIKKTENTRRFSPSVNWGWEWGGGGIYSLLCVVCREGSSICCSRKKFGVGPAFSMDLLIEKKI